MHMAALIYLHYAAVINSKTGLSVTKNMSATTRMVLDSVRTFVIWYILHGAAIHPTRQLMIDDMVTDMYIGVCL